MENGVEDPPWMLPRQVALRLSLCQHHQNTRPSYGAVHERHNYHNRRWDDLCGGGPGKVLGIRKPCNWIRHGSSVNWPNSPRSLVWDFGSFVLHWLVGRFTDKGASIEKAPFLPNLHVVIVPGSVERTITIVRIINKLVMTIWRGWRWQLRQARGDERSTNTSKSGSSFRFGMDRCIFLDSSISSFNFS